MDRTTQYLDRQPTAELDTADTVRYRKGWTLVSLSDRGLHGVEHIMIKARCLPFIPVVWQVRDDAVLSTVYSVYSVLLTHSR